MTDARFIASGDLARMAKAGKAPKNPLVRVGATPQIKAFNESARTIDFVISDGSLDRDNDTINPAGWDLTAYLKNNVVLWAHDPSQPPVAKAPDTRVVGNQLISTAIFAPKDLSPFADMIFRMYGGGFMNAVSVGFRPDKYELRSDEAGEWGCDFDTQELLEYSCVPVPANANALMRAQKSGIDTKPLIAWAEKVLDGGGMMLLPKKELETLRKAAGGSSPTVHHMGKTTQDELIRKNRTLVALDVCHPGAKDGQAFVIGGDLETKWTRDAIGAWKSAPIDPSTDKILASGEVIAKEPTSMSDPKPVYVKRQVLNHKDVHKWMKSQGYKSAVKPDDMHVTVMASKEAVDPEQLPHHTDGLTIPVHRSMPVEMGKKGALTLPVESNDLNEQHQAYCDAGCVHTQESFAPHVTLTYQRHPDHPDHNVEAYSGEIKLGAEIQEPLKDEGDDFEPPDEMELDDTYGADPDDASQGNPPKWVSDAMAAGATVVFEKVGELTSFTVSTSPAKGEDPAPAAAVVVAAAAATPAPAPASEADIRKIIAEEIAKSLPRGSTDAITIKMTDGSIIKTAEGFEAFIMASVESQIRAAQGRVD